MDITTDQLLAIADGMSIWDTSQVRSDYSGRYMYGDKCIGIVLDNGTAAEMLQLGRVLHEVGLGGLIDMAAQDSMGMGTIVYFPGVTCSTWVNDPDDDDDADEE